MSLIPVMFWEIIRELLLYLHGPTKTASHAGLHGD